MELSPAVIAIILIGLVFGAPLFIWATIRSSHQQVNILRKTGAKIKNPWQTEDEQLARLHREVESIQAASTKRAESRSDEQQESEN